jgi:hypothetical protein
MLSFVIRKRRSRARVGLYLEKLEDRALLSSVQPLPIWHTAYSTNWSGYAAETNLTTPASNAVTAVSGSWTVPTVTGTSTRYSSVWVGIDGYSSGSVEQLGTEQDTSRSGASYYAWYEMYPNPSYEITTMTISPGNSISASVTYTSAGYVLAMTDNTTHQSFSITQSTTAARSSAEWIVEAPSSYSGVLPLANFGTAKFSGAQATISGVTGAIDNSSWQNTAIDMETSSGSLLDQTSALTDTTTAPITSSFSVTYSGSSGGGGGHHHGHGPMQFAGVGAVSPSAPGAPGFSEAISSPRPATQAASGAGSLAVLPPAADSFFARVNQGGRGYGPKTWWDSY